MSDPWFDWKKDYDLDLVAVHDPDGAVTMVGQTDAGWFLNDRLWHNLAIGGRWNSPVCFATGESNTPLNVDSRLFDEHTQDPTLFCASLVLQGGIFFNGWFRTLN